MRNWKIGICVCIVIFFINNVFSQTEVYGIVKDKESNQPLIGVSVLVVGTSNGTITDVYGKYRLIVYKDNFELEFSYTGFSSKRIKGLTSEKRKLELNVELKEGIFISYFPSVIDSRIYSSNNYSYLNHEIINLQNQVNLPNIINTSPGVFMHSGALNTNRITIRGIGNRSPFSTNKVKAYLNEIPLTTGTGETTIEDIDLSLIKDIKIWRGPTSSIYGAGLGGVVEMKSIDEYPRGSFVSSNNSIGSFGLLRNTINASIQPKRKNYSFKINANSTQSDGYRANNEYDRKGITLISESYIPDKLTVLFNYTKLKAFIPSSLNEDDYLNSPTKAAFTWGQVKGFEDYDKILAGLSYQQEILGQASIVYSVFMNHRDAYESRPFNILQEKSTSVGARVLFKYFYNDDWDLKLGTEVFREFYDWTTHVTNSGTIGDLLSDNEEVRSYANVFAAFTYRFSGRLKINAGLNFNSTSYELEDLFQDTIDLSGDHNFNPIYSPRLILSYTPTNNNEFYLLASHGFAPPSLEETLAPDGSINPDIRPERAWNLEIGTRNYDRDKKINYEISLFTMFVDDLLVARRTALDQYIGINAGKTTHTGLEVHLDWEIYKNDNTQIQFKNNYTYSNFKFKEFIDDDEDYSGNELTGTAPHLLNSILFLRYKKIYSNLNFQFVDSQPLTDANTVYSDAYSLLNFKIGTSFFIDKHEEWKLDIYAGLNNIFNEKYASMHQINASSFGGNAPRYYYPGLPRNYYVGIDLKYIL